MSSSRHFNLRFGIGSPDGLRSGLWRLWTSPQPRSDVYLAPRGAASSLKVSLHESGRWQASFTSQFVDHLQKEGVWFRGTRHIELWQRPPDIAPGIALAFRIIVPHSELRAFSLIISPSKQVTWLPPPSSQMFCEVGLFFTAPDVVVSHWPGKNTMQTELLASHVLPNRETLWLVYRYDVMTEGLEKSIQIARREIERRSPDYESEDLGNIRPECRVVVGGEVHDASHYYIELAANSLLASYY